MCANLSLDAAVFEQQGALNLHRPPVGPGPLTSSAVASSHHQVAQNKNVCFLFSNCTHTRTHTHINKYTVKYKENYPGFLSVSLIEKLIEFLRLHMFHLLFCLLVLESCQCPHAMSKFHLKWLNCFFPAYLDVYGINMKSLIFKASFSIQKNVFYVQRKAKLVFDKLFHISPKQNK